MSHSEVSRCSRGGCSVLIEGPLLSKRVVFQHKLLECVMPRTGFSGDLLDRKPREASAGVGQGLWSRSLDTRHDSRVWCQGAGRDRVFHRILDFCLRHGQALPSWMAALGTNMTVATSAVHEERACPRQPHLLVFHLRRGFTSARPSSWSREGELGGSGGLCAGS